MSLQIFHLSLVVQDKRKYRISKISSLSVWLLKYAHCYGPRVWPAKTVLKYIFLLWLWYDMPQIAAKIVWSQVHGSNVFIQLKLAYRYYTNKFNR